MQIPLKSFANPNRPVLVLTAQTRWDEPPRMRHYVANYLSQHYNIIFCELNQRGLPALVYINDSLAVLKVGLYIRGLSKIGILNRAFNKIQSAVIERHLLRQKCTQVVLINFKFDFLEIYHSQLFALKYFFLNDDFVNMNPGASNKERLKIKALQARVVEQSDRVFVTSRLLGKDIANPNVPISLVYSGHDFDPSRNVNPNPTTKTNVCFMGYIHDKLEVAWLERLASNSEVTLTLVGPVESQRVRESLSKYENIQFIPPLVGAALQSYISAFDVFIMPYTTEPANTKAEVPAKLFQYLACGKPIVSSLMENIISLPEGFIYYSRTAEEFVENVLAAKTLNTAQLMKQRIAYAMEHSWEKRLLDMRLVIENDMSSSLPGTHAIPRTPRQKSKQVISRF